LAHGKAAGLLREVWPYGDERAYGADDQRRHDEPAVLDEDEPAQLPRTKTDRGEEPKFAPALEYVARNDHSQPRAAEQQPQPAERLENRQVGILHGLEFAEA